MSRVRVPISPLRVPKSASGILLFGGTFDPPHLWHVRVAEAARAVAFGEKGCIVFVPAARSPHKPAAPATPALDRIRMLRLATRGLRNVRIWTDEIDRASGRDPSYAVDTVRRLRRLHPGVRARLLIGSDQAVKFHLWRAWPEVLVNATPVVVRRPPLATDGALRRALRRTGVWTPEGVEFWLSLVADAPVDSMSSTELRGRLRAPVGSRAELRRMLDPRVLAYIRRRGLYGASLTRSAAGADARKRPGERGTTAARRAVPRPGPSRRRRGSKPGGSARSKPRSRRGRPT